MRESGVGGDRALLADERRRRRRRCCGLLQVREHSRVSDSSIARGVGVSRRARDGVARARAGERHRRGDPLGGKEIVQSERALFSPSSLFALAPASPPPRFPPIHLAQPTKNFYRVLPAPSHPLSVQPRPRGGERNRQTARACERVCVHSLLPVSLLFPNKRAPCRGRLLSQMPEPVLTCA